METRIDDLKFQVNIPRLNVRIGEKSFGFYKHNPNDFFKSNPDYLKTEIGWVHPDRIGEFISACFHNPESGITFDWALPQGLANELAGKCSWLNWPVYFYNKKYRFGIAVSKKDLLRIACRKIARHLRDSKRKELSDIPTNTPEVIEKVMKYWYHF